MTQDVATPTIKTIFYEWATLFLRLKQTPLTEQQSLICAKALSMESSRDTMIPEVLKESFPYKVFTSRAELIGLRTTAEVAMFLSLTTGSPGTLVMMVYALRYYQLIHQKDSISMAHICREIFPYGLPSEAEFEKAWDAQKFDGMNMLDLSSLWKVLVGK